MFRAAKISGGWVLAPTKSIIILILESVNNNIAHSVFKPYEEHKFTVHPHINLIGNTPLPTQAPQMYKL